MSKQKLRGSAKLHLRRLAPILIMLSLSLISTQGHAQSSAQVRQSYVALPLNFEPNRGQAGHGIDFVSHGPGYTFSLTPNRADLQFITTDPGTRRLREERTVRIKLRGANAHARAEASQAQSGTSNYFIGNNRAAWQTDIPQYGRVEYEEVYPGIDLAYYGNGRQLEYDFVVAPGADPRRIRLAIEGADQIQVDETGDLLLKVGSAEIRQRKPVLYQ